MTRDRRLLEAAARHLELLGALLQDPAALESLTVAATPRDALAGSCEWWAEVLREVAGREPTDDVL